MMKNFINDFKGIDISIINVMKGGFKASLVLCLIATYIMYLYVLNPVSHMAFDIGYSIARCGLMFFVSFLVGALASYYIINRKT